MPVTPGAATTTTDPGRLASRATRASSARAGSSSAPTTAISTGPLSAASAAASDQPANRGALRAISTTEVSALSASVRCSPEPVSAA